MTVDAKLLEPQIKNKIPIVDLASQYKTIQNEIEKEVLEVLSSGQYVLGKKVKSFEDELAKYLDCKHVISCASGTDALTLSLMSLGIKTGDEVITVSHSFFATSLAIALVGAKPVFVDIKEDDFNIDPSKIRKAITKKTRAIIPVHLYGNPCEIGLVKEIAKEHNLYVIEDCAQSLGARFNGKLVGTFGDLGAISFFPTKNLGAFGDGGAVCTNNDELAQKLTRLRIYGSSKRYFHDYIGLNSRLDEIQAAILKVKLKYLDKWNLDRQKAASYYNKLLQGTTNVIIPHVKPNINHVFHQYTIRIKNRDIVYEKLSDLEIETIIYYPVPIHMQKAFNYLNIEKGSLPVTEKICNEVLSLPIYPEITRETQEYIVENIKKIL